MVEYCVSVSQGGILFDENVGFESSKDLEYRRPHQCRNLAMLNREFRKDLRSTSIYRTQCVTNDAEISSIYKCSQLIGNLACESRKQDNDNPSHGDDMIDSMKV